MNYMRDDMPYKTVCVQWRFCSALTIPENNNIYIY